MAKDKESGVYKIVEVVGVSTVSWEDAPRRNPCATCASSKSRKWM